ncbi:hypothetical protein PCANC_25096 [Puccinia coronata f. sp. avenae]|uniref:Uncharacterized protein n=1 Tax=Puccinia coronata f. sp. avenae TaxID=200324 RepID=A0A2N5UDI8_9BASI|nr:hypothetical protein PCANC_25096 [Puccinia coronata f. sp. avenae]
MEAGAAVMPLSQAPHHLVDFKGLNSIKETLSGPGLSSSSLSGSSSLDGLTPNFSAQFRSGLTHGTVSQAPGSISAPARIHGPQENLPTGTASEESLRRTRTFSPLSSFRKKITPSVWRKLHSRIRQKTANPPSSSGLISSISATSDGPEEIDYLASARALSSSPPDASSQQHFTRTGLSDNSLEAHRPGANQASSLEHQISTSGESMRTKPSQQISHLEKSKNIMAKDLQAFSRRFQDPLGYEDSQALEAYYLAYLISNRKPTARVLFDPQTYNLLKSWDERKPAMYKEVHDFFGEILRPKEIERRKSVLLLQREHATRMAGWDDFLKLTTERLGPSTSEEDIIQAGNLIGGAKFEVPSLEKQALDQSLIEINRMELEKPKLMKSWKMYLGYKEYNSRVKLLTKISQMKHPLTIPPASISSWRSQGLDVNRMLKIIDYLPESAENNQIGLELEELKALAENLKSDIEKAKEIFYYKTKYDTQWERTLEHHELLKLPQDSSNIYNNLWNIYKKIKY